MLKAMRGSTWLLSLSQLVLVVLACILAFHFTRDFRIIPRAILSFPSVHVSPADMWAVVRVFAVSFLIQILLSLWIWRSHAFASASRFASEYLLYLVAYTSASLYLFVATTINYDVQFVAAIGVFSTVFYLLLFVLVTAVGNAGGTLAEIGALLKALAARFFSIPGLLVVLYFISPLLLGMAFAKDRDVANRITQIRIWFNPAPETDWGFRALFPGQVFEQPIQVLQAPGEPDVLYVLERVGRIYRVELTGDHARHLELDIQDWLGEVEVENGALGMEFHPNYNDGSAEYQYLYLYYTDTRPERGQVNRLGRFEFSQQDVEARRDSEELLFELQSHGGGFHNGGSILFGPDGYLYVALGEGVRTREGFRSSQVLRGAIIRIDVDGDPANLEPEPFEFGQLSGYRVPVDNPFVDHPEIRNEYWALGLRNPFRVSFDSVTGDLWVGDVGSTVWEEVNRVEPGKHYGFPMMEGRQSTGRSGWDSLDMPLMEPVYAYEHTAYDRAVIGGVVNRGDRYEGLRDHYIFADNYSAKLFAIPADRDRVEDALLLAQANQFAQRGVSSVTQLDGGEILVTTLGAASAPGGEVLLLVEASEADSDISAIATDSQDHSHGYDEEAAASEFGANCARCHGVTGDGRGPDGAALDPPVPDFTSPLYHHNRSSEELYEVIAKGGAATGMSAMMPPWEHVLSSGEIDNLVRYLQSLPDKHHRH